MKQMYKAYVLQTINVCLKIQDAFLKVIFNNKNSVSIIFSELYLPVYKILQVSDYNWATAI